jgi:hypothetical protein
MVRLIEIQTLRTQSLIDVPFLVFELDAVSRSCRHPFGSGIERRCGKSADGTPAATAPRCGRVHGELDDTIMRRFDAIEPVVEVMPHLVSQHRKGRRKFLDSRFAYSRANGAAARETSVDGHVPDNAVPIPNERVS